MTIAHWHLDVKLARSAQELRAAERLRYDVFVEELGAQGPQVDHTRRLERDEFDPFFDHLIVRDRAKGDLVVGVYRVMRGNQLARAGRFYSETEYDLDMLKTSGRTLLELGRTCVHRDYRGGATMFRLWQGLADYIQEHQIEVLFGVASFHGTDINSVAEPLSHLAAHYMAPEALRPRAKLYQPMNIVPPEQIDRAAAIRATPALIKAYLRLGGMVGDGAYIDHDFNTIDVCLVMDTARMSERSREIYTKARRPA